MGSVLVVHKVGIRGSTPPPSERGSCRLGAITLTDSEPGVPCINSFLGSQYPSSYAVSSNQSAKVLVFVQGDYSR